MALRRASNGMSNSSEWASFAQRRRSAPPADPTAARSPPRRSPDRFRDCGRNCAGRRETAIGRKPARRRDCAAAGLASGREGALICRSGMNACSQGGLQQRSARARGREVQPTLATRLCPWRLLLVLEIRTLLQRRAVSRIRMILALDFSPFGCMVRRNVKEESNDAQSGGRRDRQRPSRRESICRPARRRAQPARGGRGRRRAAADVRRHARDHRYRARCSTWSTASC